MDIYKIIKPSPLKWESMKLSLILHPIEKAFLLFIYACCNKFYKTWPCDKVYCWWYSQTYCIKVVMTWPCHKSIGHGRVRHVVLNYDYFATWYYLTCSYKFLIWPDLVISLLFKVVLISFYSQFMLKYPYFLQFSSQIVY